MLQCHKELSLYLGSARTLHTLAAHFKSATFYTGAAQRSAARIERLSQ